MSNPKLKKVSPQRDGDKNIRATAKRAEKQVLNELPNEDKRRISKMRGKITAPLLDEAELDKLMDGFPEELEKHRDNVAKMLRSVAHGMSENFAIRLHRLPSGSWERLKAGSEWLRHSCAHAEAMVIEELTGNVMGWARENPQVAMAALAARDARTWGKKDTVAMLHSNGGGIDIQALAQLQEVRSLEDGEQRLLKPSNNSMNAGIIDVTPHSVDGLLTAPRGGPEGQNEDGGTPGRGVASHHAPPSKTASCGGPQ